MKVDSKNLWCISSENIEELNGFCDAVMDNVEFSIEYILLFIKLIQYFKPRQLIPLLTELEFKIDQSRMKIEDVDNQLHLELNQIIHKNEFKIKEYLKKSEDIQKKVMLCKLYDVAKFTSINGAQKPEIVIPIVNMIKNIYDGKLNTLIV